MDYQNIIHKVQNGWFLYLNNPYSGDIDQEWKSKIIDTKTYDKEDLYGINDGFIGAIYVLEKNGKKALFTINHYHGMDGGCYFSPDIEPFIYDEIKIFTRWYEWEEFGYAACKRDDMWKLVKVTQFPKPNYEVIGEGFSSAEEAMKSIGIDDCERFLYKMFS